MRSLLFAILMIPWVASAAQTKMYYVGQGEAPVLQSVILDVAGDIAESMSVEVKEHKNLKGFSVELTEDQYLKIKREHPELGIHEDGGAEIQLDPAVGEHCIQEGEGKPDLPNFKEDWGIKKIGADKAWAVTRGKGVVVFVIDTGADCGHVGLPNLKECLSAIGDDGLDRNRHGTHVTGIIIGKPIVIDGKSYGNQGVADEAIVVSIKVLGDGGNGSMADITSGIVMANDLCLTTYKDFKCVVNMSLGGGSPFPPMETEIQRGQANGILYSCAAGNSPTQKLYPSIYCFNSVAAIDKNWKKAVFSRVGDEVDVIAPGVGIFSTIPNDKYAELSGTSMATPYHSGTLALMLSAGARKIPCMIPLGLGPEVEGWGMSCADGSVGLKVSKR